MPGRRTASEPLRRFCLALRALRRDSGNPSLAALSRLMPGHPGTSTLSDLLTANLARAPRWELVDEFVRACAAVTGSAVGASELDAWRRRHGVLIRELETTEAAQARLSDWLRSSISSSSDWNPPGIDPQRGISQKDIEEHLRIPLPVLVRSRPSSQVKSGEYPDAASVLRDTVGQKERVLLAGGPGTGKTFLLRCIYRELAYRSLQDPNAPVPFFLQLADLTLPDDAVAEVIRLISEGNSISAMRALLAARVTDQTILSELGGRPIVLLADALDEMPGPAYRDSVQRLSRLLTLKLPAVIACRTGYFDEMLGQSELDRSLSVRVDLQRITPEVVLNWFIPQWCRLMASPHAELILDTLKDDPSMRDIADRPLLVHMTVDVADQMVSDAAAASSARGTTLRSIHSYPWRPPERQWLRLDIFRHYTRRWLEVEATKTRADERNNIDIRWSNKDQAMRLIARAQFRKDAMRTGNEREHGAGLTEQEIATALKSDQSLLSMADEPPTHRYLVEDVCRRTFMIRTLRNPSSPRYRFTHKQFLEYYVAHDLLEMLSDPSADRSRMVDLLSRPLQQDSVYFLREGLGDFAARNGSDQRASSANLWRILNNEVEFSPDVSRLWVRQHAANLLPQVATLDILPRLVSLGSEEPDLFVRRGLAVGLAMHRQITDPVNAFVRLLDDQDLEVRARARSADLGYSRSYHGDRPFSENGYDDHSPEASGTTKGLVERIIYEVDFVIPIRALTLAELRCLIVEPEQRAKSWLLRNPVEVRRLMDKIKSSTLTDDLTRLQAQLLMDALRSMEELRNEMIDLPPDIDQPIRRLP